MNRTLTYLVIALLSSLAPVSGGGRSYQLEVSKFEDSGPSGAILHLSKSPWGPIKLHVQYNPARMRGVVSKDSHMSALRLLRGKIRQNKSIEIGFIGDVPGKLQGTESEYASDALELHADEKVAIWVWPTKR